MKTLATLLIGSLTAVTASADSVRATGGEMTFSPDSVYRIHTFRTDGTFTVSQPGKVDILLVGGGGGGGAGCGGGGGGGVVKVLSGVELAAGDYPVVIGLGGARGEATSSRNYSGEAGGTTSFGLDSYFAEGGGGGAAMYKTCANAPIPGGGAGNPGNDKVPTIKAGGTSTIDPSIVGGKSYCDHSSYTASVLGGGGAGAGGSGMDARVISTNWTGSGELDYVVTTNWNGNGGPGIVCDFSGEPVAYGGGGGGGGARYRGLGVDGGANGRLINTTPSETTIADSAEDNTGGGGGGGCSWSQAGGSGGNGGSGLVIVRYAVDPDSAFDTVTGGEITLDGEDEIHTFREDGQLTVTGMGFAEVLLVAGGGGGGSADSGGGGGGGGGVIYRQRILLANDTFDIVVGKGGSGGDSETTSAGVNGGDTVAFGLTAIGGGGGGSAGYNPSAAYDWKAKTGGSGGGGGFKYAGTSVQVILGAAGTDGQGYAGGASTNYWNTDGTGGGGGGAGGPGYAGSRQFHPDSGRGGPGRPIAISGKTVYYGPGGAGGVISTQANGATMNRGGLTGGGDGAGFKDYQRTISYVGAPNVGAGGGGGYGTRHGGKNTVPGGNGTDGIVIVRCKRQAYPNWAATAVGTGGKRVGRGDYYVHTFKSDDTFVLTERTAVDLFIVGGGGAGGAGGGGGGSVVALTNVVLDAGSYPVVIGSGAVGTVGGYDNPGQTGQDSSFGTYVAKGGAGGGGMYGVGQNGAVPGGGGSAAGNDSAEQWTFGGKALGNTSVVGGRGYGAHTGWAGNTLGGGGAGAGGSGVDAYVDGQWLGTGGPGVVCGFLGTDVAYGGGGGGGGCVVHGLGRDGGANGGTNSGSTGGNGADAAANTGGGGGGFGSYAQSYGKGGSGGSGIVIVRYKRDKKGMLILFR